MKKIFNKSNRIFLVAALFLMSATAKAQTYYGITAFNEGGTATETEGGVTVTVTNTGSVLDYSGCTLEVPYWEGVFDVPGGGSYIWSFFKPRRKNKDSYWRCRWQRYRYGLGKWRSLYDYCCQSERLQPEML